MLPPEPGAGMKRREFLGVLGGAAATSAWPLAVQAQQERARRIGMLLPANADDTANQARVGAFLQGLALSGWTIGRNVNIDIRWAGTNLGDIRRHATELIAVAPDVIVASGGSTVGQAATDSHRAYHIPDCYRSGW